jgi:hypothetical protein
LYPSAYSYLPSPLSIHITKPTHRTQSLLSFLFSHHDQADYHERRLAELDVEREQALARCRVAAEAEEYLKTELEEARETLLALEKREKEVTEG